MFSRDKFFTHAIILMLPQVFHLLFKVLMVNWLPRDFSVLGALVALLAIVGTPLSAATSWASYQVSHLRVENRQDALHRFLRRSISAFALVGLCATAIGVVVGLAGWGVSEVENIQVTIVFSFILSFVIVSPLLTGLLQGMQKYLIIAAFVLVFSTSKVIFGVIYTSLGMEVVGSILAVLSAYVAGVAMVVAYLFRMSSGAAASSSSSSASPPRRLAYLGYSVAALSSIALLFFFDEVMVRLLRPSEQADLFSAAKVIGLIVVYIPIPLISSMFPKVTEASARGHGTRELLVKCVAFSAVLCAGLLLFEIIFPRLVGLMTAADKPKHEGVVSLVLLYSLAIIPFAITNVVVQYGLAMGRRRFLVVLVPCALVYMAVVCIFSYDLFVLTRIIGVYGVFTAAVVCVAVLTDRTKGEPVDKTASIA